jgi:hypothetical protein
MDLASLAQSGVSRNSDVTEARERSRQRRLRRLAAILALIAAWAVTRAVLAVAITHHKNNVKQQRVNNRDS